MVLLIVVDNLFTQGVINEHLVAMSFEPTTIVNNFNGELTFGGTDASKFIGQLEFTYVGDLSSVHRDSN